MTVVRLRTRDGLELAAEVSLPDGDPIAAAVLLHPDPRMGGDMRASVPAHLFRALPRAGIAVLRFDFRGAGASGGEPGDGTQETMDVRAAIDALRAELRTTSRPEEHDAPTPLWLVGWSYGADVSLQVVDETVAGWVPICPPLRVVKADAMAAGVDSRPTWMLLAEHDQVTSPEVVRRRTAGWVATDLEVLDGTDHFLAGRLSAVADHVIGRIGR